MKPLVTLILSLSGIVAFAVAAEDVKAETLIATAVDRGPVVTPGVPHIAIRRILMPDRQSTSCNDANWPYIPARCLERIPTSNF